MAAPDGSTATVDALPAGTHLLHIGPQKTGSTALQASLHAARDLVRTHDVVYPGPERKPVRAVSAGLGVGLRRSAFTPHPRAWRDLLRQVDAGPHQRVCVSHEGFGRFDDAEAARAVDALGGARPHVLAAARRLDDLLPSQWQQRIKAGKRWPYLEWLRLVLDADRDSRAWRNLWSGHDTVALVERWAAVVGHPHVTVVVLDRTDPRRLHATVERLLGLPEGLLPAVDDHANRSLDFEEAELVRAVNTVFAALPHQRDEDWRALVGEGAIAAILRAHRRDAPAVGYPPLPDWARTRLHELSERRIAGLTRLAERGVTVVGDLDALRVAAPGTAEPAAADEQPAVTSVPLALAATALGGVLRRAVADRADWADRAAGSTGPTRRRAGESSR